MLAATLRRRERGGEPSLQQLNPPKSDRPALLRPFFSYPQASPLSLLLVDSPATSRRHNADQSLVRRSAARLETRRPRFLQMNPTTMEHDYRFPRRPDGRQLGDHDRRTL